MGDRDPPHAERGYSTPSVTRVPSSAITTSPSNTARIGAPNSTSVWPAPGLGRQHVIRKT